MASWKFIGRIIADGEAVLLEGLNPWEHEWEATDEPAFLEPHPEYPDQHHSMNVYEITDGTKVVKFAAGEFANCAWGFYLPDSIVLSS